MCEQATSPTQSGVGEDGWHDKSLRATPQDLSQSMGLKSNSSQTSLGMSWYVVKALRPNQEDHHSLNWRQTDAISPFSRGWPYN